MKLVFVHGMRQEGKDHVSLRQSWEGALKGAWIRLGLKSLDPEIEMPFYGDRLDALTREIKGEPSDVVARSDWEKKTSQVERDIIREMVVAYELEAAVNEELAVEVIARSPANWEWVQAAGRVLEHRVPMFRGLGLGFVQQVDAYLTRPHVHREIDDIVEPALSGKPAVIVSHSLGTVVTYSILRRQDRVDPHPILVTLGSPLGINAVKDCLKPPKLAIPNSVASWLNGTDDRDYVALYASLDGKTFVDGIENVIDLKNRREDAHLITDYLANDVIATRIHAALMKSV